MKFSYEKINKGLMLIALLSLLYRKGNFYNSFIPKPFEIIFAVLILSTFIYIIKNQKIKTLFLSISKEIWVTVSCLFLSVLLGWITGIFFREIEISQNMILEFGTFTISISLMILVLFYTKDDQLYARMYLYALLFPLIYTFFSFFPGLALGSFVANDGNFLGLASNVNVISKILLVPAIFFSVYSLFNWKLNKTKISFIIMAASLFTLIFWTASRGSILSLILGLVFTCTVFIFRDFSWRKTIATSLIVLIMLTIGFVMTPYERKQVAFNRLLNQDNVQSDYESLKEKSISLVIQESIHPVIQTNPLDDNRLMVKTKETRLQIWPFYLRYVLANPLGVGPNTHMESNILNKNGEVVSSGPHNTYIQVWLWGGLLGLLSFIYLLVITFKNLKLRLKNNFDPFVLALMCILFTLLVSFMFDDSLSFFWFWVILGLSLQKQSTDNRKTI